MTRAATLATDRLVLRRPEPRDVEGYIAFGQSLRARWSVGVRGRAESWRDFAAVLGHWQMRGWGLFAVTLPGDDACRGLVGPWFPDGRPEPEIAWLLWAADEGRGYATEAARAARAHAYGALGWPTAVSYIEEGNTRSIAVAERLGATLDAAAPTLRDTVRVYRHPAPGAAA